MRMNSAILNEEKTRKRINDIKDKDSSKISDLIYSVAGDENKTIADTLVSMMNGNDNEKLAFNEWVKENTNNLLNYSLDLKALLSDTSESSYNKKTVIEDMISNFDKMNPGLENLDSDWTLDYRAESYDSTLDSMKRQQAIHKNDLLENDKRMEPYLNSKDQFEKVNDEINKYQAEIDGAKKQLSERVSNGVYGGGDTYQKLRGKIETAEKKLKIAEKKRDAFLNDPEFKVAKNVYDDYVKNNASKEQRYEKQQNYYRKELKALAPYKTQAVLLQALKDEKQYKETQNDIDLGNEANSLEDEAAMASLELQAQKAITEGKQQEYELIRRKIALEKLGIEATNENLQKYRQVLNETICSIHSLNKSKFNQYIFDNEQKIKDDYISKYGTRKQKFEMFKNQAELQTGMTLNQGTPEYKKLVRLYKKQELSEKLDFLHNMASSYAKDPVIKSNELAQRGGFTGSVVVDNRDKISQKILNLLEKRIPSIERKLSA